MAIVFEGLSIVLQGVCSLSGAATVSVFFFMFASFSFGVQFLKVKNDFRDSPILEVLLHPRKGVVGWCDGPG